MRPCMLANSLSWDAGLFGPRSGQVQTLQPSRKASSYALWKKDERHYRNYISSKIKSYSQLGKAFVLDISGSLSSHYSAFSLLNVRFVLVVSGRHVFAEVRYHSLIDWPRCCWTCLSFPEVLFIFHHYSLGATENARLENDLLENAGPENDETS